jgi:hypothetical protein
MGGLKARVQYRYFTSLSLRFFQEPQFSHYKSGAIPRNLSKMAAQKKGLPAEACSPFYFTACFW